MMCKVDTSSIGQSLLAIKTMQYQIYTSNINIVAKAMRQYSSWQKVITRINDKQQVLEAET